MGKKILLVMVIMFLCYLPGDYIYAEGEATNDIQEKQADGNTYEILSGTQKIGKPTYNYEQYFYMEFPTEGKVTFFSTLSELCNYVEYTYDTTSGYNNSTSDITTFSSENVTAGTHYIYCYNIDGNQYATVSYTFYPKCKIYYIYNNSSKFLDSYFLQTSSSKMKISTPNIAGYEVTGLYTDSQLENEITSIDKSVGKDWYVYPKTEPISYSINYNLDGGCNSEKNISTYTIEEDDFVLYEASKEGYTFDGWYTDQTFKNSIKTIDTSACKDINLYAKWEAKKYSIEYDDAYTHSNPIECKFTDKDIILEDAEREGFVFEGWYADKEYTQKQEIVSPQFLKADVNLYAKWKAKEYTVTYELNGGENNLENITTFTVETRDFLLREPIRENYTFEGWYLDENYTKNITYIIPTQNLENLTLYAKWEDNSITYKILKETKTLEAGGSNGVDRWNIVLPSDGRIIFSSSQRGTPGFLLDDNVIANTKNDISDYSGVICQGMHTLILGYVTGGDYMSTVTYEFYPECNIYYMDNEVSEKLTSFYLQEKSEKLILPNAEFKGYTFEGWYSDENLTIPIATVDKSHGKDYLLYPKKKVNSYKITYVLNGGENNSANPNEYTIESDDVLLRDPIREGYDFEGWYSDVALTKKLLNVETIECKDIVLYASWKKHIYDLNSSNISVQILSNESEDDLQCGIIYNGEQQTSKVVVSDGGIELEENKDYTVSYLNNTSAGEATIIITGIGEYTGEVVKKFMIVPKAIVPVIDKINTKEYTGFPITPAITVRDGEKILFPNIDYTVQYSDNIDAGTANVIIRGVRNYSFSVEQNFKIIPKNIGNVKVENVVTKTYTGRKLLQKGIKIFDGQTVIDSDNYVLKYKNNKNVGTATVTVKGINNYTGSKIIKFNIIPKGTKIRKVTYGLGKCVIKFSKQKKQTTGYELQYSSDSKFKKNVKKIRMKNNVSLKKIKYNQKKIFVRIRTYKRVGSRTFYSDWSRKYSATISK